MERKYWYSFSFVGKHPGDNSGRLSCARTSIGYPHKYVSLPQIDRAKESAGVDKHAVLLSCCYLGRMTGREMDTGIPEKLTFSGFFRDLYAKFVEMRRSSSVIVDGKA